MAGEKKTTMMLVTHDIDESIYLGNEIVLMQARPGRIHKILPVNLPFFRVIERQPLFKA
ncbi:hypothetical protein BsIDN1_16480 [Bacillus safensis]|uniref:ABC transporter domain-containing protein n=1 Tax=Bacillus safensis TaxID=561879 RepID=A0A5S9M379_BACIA|nr:hypothetical protein BsIDN1_16480 [Bacillus safensis]